MEQWQHIDLRFFYIINDGLASAWLDDLCLVLRGKYFLSVFYALVAVLVYRRYPAHFIYVALIGGLTFFLTDQISASLIKPLVARLRPCNDPGVQVRLVAPYCGSGFSFVSAHAANSFGMALFFSFLFQRRWITLFFLLWAVSVAFSQVYVGVHYPGDVIGGGLLGSGIGSLTGYLWMHQVRPQL